MFKNSLLIILFISLWINGNSQDYCTPSSSYSYDYIDSFSTTGGDDNITNSSTGYSTGGYSDYTALFVKSTAGSSFNYEITTNFGSSYVTVWIDWNNDQSFDSTEQIASTNGSTISGTANIPADAVDGDYRMRLEMHPSYITADPCSTSLSYGEFEDYTIRVGAASTCPKPSTLEISNTTSSANISWVTGGTETAWEVVVQDSSLPEPTSGTAVSATTYEATGLTADTEYNVYVRANCGTEISSWTTGSFITGYCLPEGTDTYDYISNFTTSGGTTNINNTTANDANGYGDYTDNIVESYEDGKIDFNITTNGNFYGSAIWIDWNQDYTFSDDEKVYETVSYNGSSNINSGSITVPAGTAKSQYRLRVGAVKFGNTISDACTTIEGEYEDYTLSIGDAPSCILPSDVTLSNLTQTSVDISWIAGNTETDWEVVIQEAGTEAPTSGTPTTETSYSATNLTPDTTYDVYVRANCGDSNSVWTDATTFITGYCSPITSSTTYYIDSFVVNGNTNVSTGIGTNGYTDNSSTIIEVNAGNEFSFQATTVQSYNSYFAIWVDWNNDFVFDDTERIINEYGSTNFSGSLPFPIELQQGSYRLRAAIGTNSETCSTYFGEYEDFTLKVSAPKLTPGVENTCVESAPVEITTLNYNTSIWVPLYINGELVAELNANGQSIGDVTANLYNSSKLRSDELSTSNLVYLFRNFSITSSNLFANPVGLRLYFTNTDYSVLANTYSETTFETLQIRHGAGGSCGKEFDAGTGDSMIDGAVTKVNNDIFYIEFNTPSFSSFFISQGVSTILPVDLVSFNGEANANGNLLSWSTENEVNNSHFDVEKSSNGQLFETIGRVEGNGTIASAEYSFTDANGGNAYYRLKQVDFDGKSSYSNVIFVESSDSLQSLSVYPNPAIDRLTIDFKGTKTANVTLTNVFGATLLNKEVLGNKVDLDISEYPQGVYYLTVKGLGINTTQKIIKQ